MTGPDKKAGRKADTTPKATALPPRRVSMAWILPLAAVLLAAALGYAAWRQRGYLITVRLPHGHQLRSGDVVRYRGIVVGEVRDARITPDLQEVLVRVALSHDARPLARAGTRFWVVRPELNLSGIEGIETLVGPRYLATLPGRPDAEPQRHFVGLASAPAVESIAPGDLEIVLESPRRGSLKAGAPVSFREVRVGTVLSVGLASDGGAVEARVHIDQAYRELVRRHTRFWFARPLRIDVGLTGASIEMGSLEAMVAGGVALATPPPEEAGAIVRTGHRFTLHDEADDEWLEWTPTVPIGNSLLPPGAVMPSLLRASLQWRQGLFKSHRSRHGWALPTSRGLLAPADLLEPDEKADPASVELEVGGRLIPLNAPPPWQVSGLARLDAVKLDETAWPDRLVREAKEPEDCLIVADTGEAPVPVAASRLRAEEGAWRIDAEITFDDSWHGACVMSRRDGALVGVLLVDGKRTRIARIEGWD